MKKGGKENQIEVELGLNNQIVIILNPTYIRTSFTCFVPVLVLGHTG